MPYIDDERKRAIWITIDGETPQTAGELNYCFTFVALEYLKARGKSYQTINDILGALEGCKQEIYRRVAVPYEDGKIKENGDVFPPSI